VAFFSGFPQFWTRRKQRFPDHEHTNKTPKLFPKYQGRLSFFRMTASFLPFSTPQGNLSSHGQARPILLSPSPSSDPHLKNFPTSRPPSVHHDASLANWRRTPFSLRKSSTTVSRRDGDAWQHSLEKHRSSPLTGSSPVSLGEF